MKNFILKLLPCATLLLAGCSSIVNSHYQKAKMMENYLAGKNAEVAEHINDKLDADSWTSVVNTGDEIMWRLEAGSINFHMGNFAECVNQFARAEELIMGYDDRARISVRDVSAEAGAALSNMNALPYRGFCRDRMALSIYKSIAYLGMDRESSFRAQLKRLRNAQKKVQNDYQELFDAEKAELNQAKAANAQIVQEKNPDMSAEELANAPDNAALQEKLKDLSEVAHRGYGNFLNPAAIFLSALGSMRDENFENARIDLKRLYEAMPKNPMAQRYYVTVLKKTNRHIPSELRNVQPFNFPLEKNCVYVIFANGQGAAFQQISIYFPIMTAWPVCEFYPSTFKNMQVTADGTDYRSLILADMDGIFAQEFKERLPGIITRIILSTAIKEAAYYAALAAANSINDMTARAIALTSVAVAGTAYRIATNTADTRSWELLPKEFQLTQFPMPKNRTVTIALEGHQYRTASVEIPEHAKSAIIYVSAVNENNVKYHVFPMCSDGEKHAEETISENFYSSKYSDPSASANSTSNIGSNISVPSHLPDSGAVKNNGREFVENRKQQIKKQAKARAAELIQARKELDRLVKSKQISGNAAEKRVFKLTCAAVSFAKSKKTKQLLTAMRGINRAVNNHKNLSLLTAAYGNVLCEPARSAFNKRNYADAIKEYQAAYPFMSGNDMFFFACSYERMGNYNEALAKYSEAQKIGNDNAYLSAANIYLSRQYGVYDEQKGIECMTAAANAGLPVAQYKLGCIYANFENSKYDSVPYNRSEAQKWLEAAAANKFFPARNALNRLK